MVAMHAALKHLPAGRSTVDVDATLHLETRAITFQEVERLLNHAGYGLDDSTSFAYRFDRGRERIDVMCSDRHAAWKRPTSRGRPLFGIPGGTRALQNTIELDLNTAQGPVRLVIPTVRGALILKGAAFREDSRDRQRHAEDGVLLLACLDDPDSVLPGLSTASRTRLRSLIRALAENSAPWAGHAPIVQQLARESAEALHHPLGL